MLPLTVHRIFYTVLLHSAWHVSETELTVCITPDCGSNVNRGNDDDSVTLGWAWT